MISSLVIRYIRACNIPYSINHEGHLIDCFWLVIYDNANICTRKCIILSLWYEQKNTFMKIEKAVTEAISRRISVRILKRDVGLNIYGPRFRIPFQEVNKGI